MCMKAEGEFLPGKGLDGGGGWLHPEGTRWRAVRPGQVDAPVVDLADQPIRQAVQRAHGQAGGELPGGPG